jgi:predicted transcriptional regulator of viral defense system
MNFLEFKDKLFGLACFSTDQVYAWKLDFDRNNFGRWVKKGLIIRLRRGYYTFPEYREKSDFALYFANRIYRPSYVSLHTALSFYGMIPESVVQISSVTTLKTTSFSNAVADYSYKSVKTELMFGYQSKALPDGRTILMARPEKAVLDLLYLYPQYQSPADMLELRLDADYLYNDLNKALLIEYVAGFKSISIDKRVSQLIKVYEL